MCNLHWPVSQGMLFSTGLPEILLAAPTLFRSLNLIRRCRVATVRLTNVCSSEISTTHVTLEHRVTPMTSLHAYKRLYLSVVSSPVCSHPPHCIPTICISCSNESPSPSCAGGSLHLPPNYYSQETLVVPPAYAPYPLRIRDCGQSERWCQTWSWRRDRHARCGPVSGIHNAPLTAFCG